MIGCWSSGHSRSLLREFCNNFVKVLTHVDTDLPRRGIVECHAQVIMDIAGFLGQVLTIDTFDSTQELINYIAVNVANHKIIKVPTHCDL